MRQVASITILLVSIHSSVFAEPESKSFIIHSFRGGPPADDVARQCQSVREQIHAKWLGNSSMESWQPCCEVVVHATKESYVHSVGRGGTQTSGSSLIRFGEGKITRRRLDLLVDQYGRLPALHHELTHVVLADRFAGKLPPRWADEGIATLADSTTKQLLHQRDCLAALKNGTSIRMVDLLRLEEFTSHHQVPAFYGQSLSLIRFLAHYGEPLLLVPFLEQADTHGYDRALREMYDIDGVSHLEKLWRDYAHNLSQELTSR